MKEHAETTSKLAPKYNAEGLILAIAQDAHTGEVLMAAHMNAEALRRTLETQKATYFSRSRGRLWVKGEQSGHFQRVVEALVDCDQDCVLLKVDTEGRPACHAGFQSCFYRRIEAEGRLSWAAERVFDPDQVYGKER